MFIAADIGNTNTTFGIFSGEKLIDTASSESSERACQKLLGDLSSKYDIKEGLISSVKDEVTEGIKSIIDKAFGINSGVLSTDMKLGIRIKSNNPSSAGADRIANAAAAKKLYSLPAIVVDVGTATTFDVVNEEGVFIGGTIIPGINMQLAALSQNTSKLPEIHAEKTNVVISNTTKGSILSGVIRGHACAIEGLLKLSEKELGTKPTVILTGGQAGIISEYVGFDELNPHLTLWGIKFIHELNT